MMAEFENDLRQYGSEYEGLSESANIAGQPEAVRINSWEEAAKLPGGTLFYDPADKKTIRTARYRVKNPAEAYDLPDMAPYFDDQGNPRVAPKYEGLNFTAQSLYSMAGTDHGREEILREHYKDAEIIKSAKGEMVLKEKDGTYRRPGAGRSRGGTMGVAAAELAPAIGMGVGSGLGIVGGGAAGTAVAPGPGTVAGMFGGAAGGGVLGSMLGQSFNQMVLGLAGYHDRSLPEQVRDIGMAGTYAAGGEMIGRGVSKLPAVIEMHSAYREMKRLAGAAAKDGSKTVKAALLDPEKREVMDAAMRKFTKAAEAAGITPKAMRKFLGVTDQDIERASRLAAQGVMVPLASYATEAPMLRKIQSEFDPQFRRQNVLAESARNYYEAEGTGILQELPKSGTSLDELIEAPAKIRADAIVDRVPKEKLPPNQLPLTRSTAQVNPHEAGQLNIDAARFDLAYIDSQVEMARVEMQRALMAPIKDAGGPEGLKAQQDAAVKTLEGLAVQSKNAAHEVIQQAALSLRQATDKAIAEAAGGERTGDLWRTIAEKFKEVNMTTRLRARHLYDLARDATRTGSGQDIPVPGLGQLTNDAEAFMNSIPQGLREKYPSEIKMLARLAGFAEDTAAADVVAGQTGGAAVPAHGAARVGHNGAPPPPLSWVDLHQLRSWMRHGIDYTDLTPDMRQGSLKLFADKIDKVLHDPKAPAELRRAAKLLDNADAYYKKEIPFLNDEMVRNVMKGIEGGVANDPKALAEVLFQPGRTEAMKRAQKLLGAPLWNGVRAANTQAMLDASKTLTGDFDGHRFAQQILAQHRDGIIEAAYTPTEAVKLFRLAQQAEMVNGKIPINPQEGDTIFTLLRKAEDYAARAKLLAKEDPLRVLNSEMKLMQKSFEELDAEVATQLARNPLQNLAKDSMSGMAVQAGEEIIASPDKIRAVAQQFGLQSPEMNAVRQVYVWRRFQREFSDVRGMRAQVASKSPEVGISDETQAIMFPGISKKRFTQLLEDMEFLLSDTGTDVGGSMAANTRVINPQNHLPIPVPKGIFKFPPAVAGARFALGKTFATISEGLSNPVWIDWLAGKLSGDAADREIARRVFQQSLRMGGWYGQAAAEASYNPKKEQRPPLLPFGLMQ